MNVFVSAAKSNNITRKSPKLDLKTLNYGLLPSHRRFSTRNSLAHSLLLREQKQPQQKKTRSRLRRCAAVQNKFGHVWNKRCVRKKTGQSKKQTGKTSFSANFSITRSKARDDDDDDRRVFGLFWSRTKYRVEGPESERVSFLALNLFWTLFWVGNWFAGRK